MSSGFTTGFDSPLGVLDLVFSVVCGNLSVLLGCAVS